jgi:hypothetical protein
MVAPPATLAQTRAQEVHQFGMSFLKPVSLVDDDEIEAFLGWILYLFVTKSPRDLLITVPAHSQPSCLFINGWHLYEYKYRGRV